MMLTIAVLCFVAQIAAWIVLPGGTPAPAPAVGVMEASEGLAI